MMAGRILTSATRHPRCTLCGKKRPRHFRHSSTGDVFCASHPWCPHCRTAHLDSTCDEQRHLVVSGKDAQIRTAAVLGDLRTLGITLPHVPLSLVARMPGPEEGRCLRAFSGPLRSRSARIEILTGLGPTRFAHVVAHEHTHALVHLHGGPPVDPLVEEGLCELVAVVWLTSQGARQEVLNDLWANPHPAYGQQMRRLVRLARRDSVGVLLARVLATGHPE